MLISVFSYVTWVGMEIRNPAWFMSTVFTEIPGMVTFLAKNRVRGHLLHTSSYWHWTIGWDLLIASR
jgi:hypothetical protein